MQTKNMMLAILLTTLVACQAGNEESEQAAHVAQPAEAERGMVSGVISNMKQEAEVKPDTQPATTTLTAKVAEQPAIKEVTPEVAEPTKPVAVVSQPEPEAKPVVSGDESSAMTLAKKSNCLVCHSIKKKMVGPAWRDVGIKYKNDVGAEKRLIEKVAKGGSGAWGAMAMPPQAQVSEADRRTLVRFILSLK